MSNRTCSGCGMPVEGEAYHPWAACELFKASHSSKTVEANLQAVVEYGMRAQRAGVSIETAMSDLSRVVNPSLPTAL